MERAAGPGGMPHGGHQARRSLGLCEGSAMYWIFTAAGRLRKLGILGMNRRNAACILDHNPRILYPLVDDKLRMRDLCLRIGVPTPAIYAEITYHSMLRHLEDYLGGRDDFVIKPNRGSAGRGVLVVVGKVGGNYLRHN